MTDQNDKLADLLLRWEESWDHGEDIPASELCADCPELIDQLQQQINALKRMAWMKKDPCEDDTEDEPQPDPLVSKTLAGRYRIEELIAEGGFGRVYRAFDPELDRPVAIKIPKANRVAAQEQDAFLDEARKAAKLRHPGIVSVHDVGRDDDLFFIVSDFIDGKNLAEIIANGHPAPMEAARIVAEIAENLHVAHENGFIHRDIKPANILVDEQGHPLITDFGIAASIEKVGEATSGTLPYMAPEQIAGEVQLIDARTDIYALGVVLYELLTRRLPHQARTPTALREQVLFRQPESIRSIDPAVPTELEKICFRCLAKHPADRFRSADQIAKALRACISGQAKSRRRRLILGIVAIMLVLLCGKYLPGLLEGRLNTEPPKPEGVFVFDGINRIVTPVERFAPVTLEAWVRPERGTAPPSFPTFVIGGDINGHFGIGFGTTEGRLHAQYLTGILQSNQIVPMLTWSHLAAVFAETETRLYFNGRLVETGPPTQRLGGAPFVIGCLGEDSNAYQFVGQIRCLRISAGERYPSDFVPDERFEPDAAAVLIYDGKAIDGDKIIDLSGKGNHGRLQMTAVNQATPSLRPKVLVFDGASRIVTPVERFAPVTLEAWVYPDRFESRSHFVIGSDVPSQHGISLVLAPSLLCAEYIVGEMLNSGKSVPVKEWSHVAAVFATHETRLYFNGELVATGPATEPLGGTHFVIGNAGETNPMYYFLGEIRSVRISRGERYTDEFTPEQEFVKDAADAPSKAVLIYDGSSVEGDKVIDLSGEGNHGRWERLSP